LKEARKLLAQTLAEEKETDEALTTIASELNMEAVGEE
jgi:ferritin-like metal-binding protein YciE